METPHTKPVNHTQKVKSLQEFRSLHATTFLCGQFITGKSTRYIISKLTSCLDEYTNDLRSSSDTPAQFQPLTYSPNEREEISGIFHSRFFNSMHPDSYHQHKAFYKDVKSYTISFEKEVHLAYKDEAISVLFDRLDLFFFPKGLLLYSFRMRQNGLTYDAITYCNATFRAITRYVNTRQETEKLNVGEDFLSLFQPLICIHNVSLSNNSPQTIPAGDYSVSTVKRYQELLKNGNKLKCFVVAEEDPAQEYPAGYTRENLLFDMATNCPIGASIDPENPFHPSPDYYRQLVDNNKINYFWNWQGLALFDSFVVVLDRPQYYQLEAWHNEYFRFIYIHSLFVKNYLSEINKAFRKARPSIHLADEFQAFDKIFNLHHISHNFLPQAIYEKIRIGLEIDSELEQLHVSLERESAKQEKQREQRMNLILAFVALLAIFSSIKDGADWFIALGWLPNEGSAYNLFTLIELVLVVVIPVGLYIRHKKLSK